MERTTVQKQLTVPACSISKLEKSLKGILENILVKLLSHGRSGIPFPTPELGETSCLFCLLLKKEEDCWFCYFRNGARSQEMYIIVHIILQGILISCCQTSLYCIVLYYLPEIHNTGRNYFAVNTDYITKISKLLSS